MHKAATKATKNIVECRNWVQRDKVSILEKTTEDLDVNCNVFFVLEGLKEGGEILKLITSWTIVLMMCR